MSQELENQGGAPVVARPRYAYDFTRDLERYQGARDILTLRRAALGLTLLGDYHLSGLNGERDRFFDYGTELLAEVAPGDSYDLDTHKDQAIEMLREIMESAEESFKSIRALPRQNQAAPSAPSSSSNQVPSKSSRQGAPVLGSYERFLADRAQQPRSGGGTAADTSAFEAAFKGPWDPKKAQKQPQRPAMPVKRHSVPLHPRKAQRPLPRGRANPDLTPVPRSTHGDERPLPNVHGASALEVAIAAGHTGMVSMRDVLATSSSHDGALASNKRVGSDTGVDNPTEAKRARNEQTSEDELSDVDPAILSELSSLTDSDPEGDNGRALIGVTKDAESTWTTDDEDGGERDSSVGSEEMARAADQAAFDAKKSREGSILIARFKASVEAREAEREEIAVAEWARNVDHAFYSNAEARREHLKLQARRKGWKKPKAQRQGTLYPAFGSRFVLTDDDIYHIDCGSGAYRSRGPRLK
ncbi:hypothetical protein CYLTODRAFT_441548 [Cylindrobasidium torrendii FP15055 ss-10]|uniref:Uncharacterized protein n=1 Tax=Cylindrobasidium torrendii FP15055 ss-10 TaxID=1314674 RepID=A0A0D7BLF5_9AGAR|nr:hypothetical protein CYLTODRAFT_441548 [Cylindrobasidium torrendii FP15055 ss-10]